MTASSPPVAALLEPVALGAGAAVARNRIVFGPHPTNLARRRSVSDRHVAYYRRRAAGGTGVIVVEEASVHPSDWPYERCPLAAESAEGWAAVAGACAEEGAVVLAGLGHSGGQGSSAYSQAPLWAPSRVPEVDTREVPKQMEEEDIAAVVAGFADAARLAAEAGLAGVEVNAGQHSLLRQFLSGLTNQRTDRFGEDRTLLVRTVVGAVRQAAPQLVLALRLSCDEMAPWAGIVPEAGAQLAAELAPLVDLLTVVRGSIFTVSATRPDGHVAPGFNRQLCAAVRQAVRTGTPAPAATPTPTPTPAAAPGPAPSARAADPTPVVAQGSIVEPAMAAQLVADGVADLVEMTRAQIADPDLVAKMTAGRPERIRPCILCNQACMVRDSRNPIVSCVGEPSAGHETEDPPVPGPRPGPAEAAGGQPLLVVGGGPAGLECARVAALLGHRVRLVERSASLGGALSVAATAAGRGRLQLLVDWLAAECELLQVELVTGTAATAELVDTHGGPVVLCTGGRPGRGGYDVAGGAVVVPAAEALRRLQAPPSAAPDSAASPAGTNPPGTNPPGTNPAAGDHLPEWVPLPDGPVAVWDPVGGPIGISLAETLRGAGRQVTLLTPDLIAGEKLSLTGDLAPANTRLQQQGVTIGKRSLLRRVEAGRVTVEDRFTGEHVTVPAAVVVDAGHLLPDDELWQASAGRHRRAGDAVAPRTVLQAVLEGRRAAQALGPAAGAHR